MNGNKLVTSLLSLALAAALAGCSTYTPNVAYLDVDMVMPPDGTRQLPPEYVSSIVDKVEERNKNVEDTKQWIDESYSGLMLRRMVNVSSGEYKSYKQYLDDGAVYIIVHPAYFTFFHYTKNLRRSTDENDDKLNIVELLLKRRPSTPQFAVMQAQERRMRDFIEFKSTEKKLIILVVPQKYFDYSGYTYKGSQQDEYMRYLNEIANMSPSVLFVESRDPNRGYLTDDDAMKLMEFLMSVDAENVYIGGGYVGRCLEDFYSLLTDEYGKEGIYVLPGLSDISPRELSSPLAMHLLRPDGKLDHELAAQLMVNNAYKIQEVIPQIIDLK